MKWELYRIRISSFDLISVKVIVLSFLLKNYVFCAIKKLMECEKFKWEKQSKKNNGIIKVFISKVLQRNNNKYLKIFHDSTRRNIYFIYTSLKNKQALKIAVIWYIFF